MSIYTLKEKNKLEMTNTLDNLLPDLVQTLLQPQCKVKKLNSVITTSVPLRPRIVMHTLANRV